MTSKNKSILIGLTGCSGSGKSTFLKKIIEGFSVEEVCLISQDNYYKPRNEQPVDEAGRKNFDLPESLYLETMIQDVKSLLDGNPVHQTEYLYNQTGKMPSQIVLIPARILIIEGLFIYYAREIRELIDFKLFIEARENIMLKRRIIRDQEERGYDLEDVLYRFENHVMPTYYRYILPFREESDLVIPNNLTYHNAVMIVRGFLKTILSGTL